MRPGSELFQELANGNASDLVSAYTVAELHAVLSYCRDEEIVGMTWIAALLELESRFLAKTL